VARKKRAPQAVPTPTLAAPVAAPMDDAVAGVLHDAAELWATIWRTSGEYIAVVDQEGIIRACNRVDDGFSLDQVVGHSLMRFTTPESSAALEATMRRVLDEGEMRTLETTVRRLDGDLSYFALRLAPLRRDGRVVAALVCGENIRPLKNTEQALTRERSVLRRLLEIQENERQLVSYEIHDGLAQYLAGAIMHLEAHLHALQGREPRELVEGVRLLRAAADESRRLISGLRPPALDELGIVEAIESLVADARTEIPSVAFTHALPGERLPPALETTIFRIVQESLFNTRKHAAARHVAVSVKRHGNVVRVAVQDDGRGFDPARVPEQRFGLEGIRQRSRLAGAEARITSARRRGSSIEVDLPIPAGEPA
jgi:PAS domain S-box-containing protein